MIRTSSFILINSFIAAPFPFSRQIYILQKNQDIEKIPIQHFSLSLMKPRFPLNFALTHHGLERVYYFREYCQERIQLWRYDPTFKWCDEKFDQQFCQIPLCHFSLAFYIAIRSSLIVSHFLDILSPLTNIPNTVFSALYKWPHRFRRRVMVDLGHTKNRFTYNRSKH